MQFFKLTTTELLGILGFALSLLNFIIQISRYIFDRRASLRKERYDCREKIKDIFITYNFSQTAYEPIAMMIREVEITEFDVLESYFQALLKSGKAEAEAVKMLERFHSTAIAIVKAQTSIRKRNGFFIFKIINRFKVWMFFRKLRH